MRTLSEDWTIEGTAREALRLASAWVFTGAPADNGRIGKEGLRHPTLGFVVSVTRYDIVMKFPGKTVPKKFLSLYIRFAEEDGKQAELNWAIVREFVDLIFGEEQVHVWTRAAASPDGVASQQFTLFYNQVWKAEDFLDAKVLAGASLWIGHDEYRAA